MGNDFLITEDIGLGRKNYSRLAEQICHRRTGIGSDGLMVRTDSEFGDTGMVFFNSDGSEAKMCGNGVRCFSHYCFMNCKLTVSEIRIHTDRGCVSAWKERLTDKEGNIFVNLGEVSLATSEIPMSIDEEEFIDRKIDINGQLTAISALTIGSIHAVVFVDSFDMELLAEKSKSIMKNSLFPEGININFAKRIGDEKIELRTWERGVGYTYSCGSGSIAAVYLNNRLYGGKSKCSVISEGGIITVEKDKGGWLLGGVTKYICHGIYNYEVKES